jgi:hypothetical protein
VLESVEVAGLAAGPPFGSGHGRRLR